MWTRSRSAKLCRQCIFLSFAPSTSHVSKPVRIKLSLAIPKLSENRRDAAWLVSGQSLNLRASVHLLPLSLHLSAIAPFLTLFCVFLLEFPRWQASLALGFAPRLLSNRCTVVTIQLNPRTAARDGPRHIARHGVRQGRPSCIGAMVCSRALQRPGSRAKRLRCTFWCVWPHRQLPIIPLLCTKQVRFCVPLLAAAPRSGLRTPFQLRFPFQRPFR